MHSKLKESPVASPRTRVEPAKCFRRQLTDHMNIQSLSVIILKEWCIQRIIMHQLWRIQGLCTGRLCIEWL